MHLNKLTTFPVLAPKDNKGLQELGDLLLELQCAKEDGGLAGLKILDEPAFLKPVLVKPPEELQGRWQRHAYCFKSQHGVDYPLFGSLPLSFKRLHKNGMTCSYPWRSKRGSATRRNHLSSHLSNLQSNLLMSHPLDKASQHLGLTSQMLHSRVQLLGTLPDGASFTNYHISAQQMSCFQGHAPPRKEESALLTPNPLPLPRHN